MLFGLGYPENQYAVANVSKEYGVSQPSLRRWFKERDTPESKELIRQEKTDLAARFEKIAFLSQGVILDKLQDPDQAEQISIRDAIIVAGTATDKHQLLTGNATERTEIVESPRERLIDRLDQRAAKIGAGRADHVNDGSGSASPTA